MMKAADNRSSPSQIFRASMQSSAEKTMQKSKTVIMTAMVQAGMPKSDRLAMLEYFEEQSEIIGGIKDWSIWKILQKITRSVLRIIFSQVICILKTKEKDFINKNLLSVLPEEWQAEFHVLQKRWIKKEYSGFKVRRLTIRYLSDMYFTVVKIKIENFYFFNRSSKKETD